MSQEVLWTVSHCKCFIAPNKVGMAEMMQRKKYKKNSNGSCHPEHISIKEAMYE